MLELFLAVLALQMHFIVTILHRKTRRDRLEATDAVAVRAAQHAFDTVRQARLQLLDYHVVIDAIDRCVRRVHRQLIDL